MEISEGTEKEFNAYRRGVEEGKRASSTDLPTKRDLFACIIWAGLMARDRECEGYWFNDAINQAEELIGALNKRKEDGP